MVKFNKLFLHEGEKKQSLNFLPKKTKFQLILYKEAKE